VVSLALNDFQLFIFQIIFLLFFFFLFFDIFLLLFLELFAIPDQKFTQSNFFTIDIIIQLFPFFFLLGPPFFFFLLISLLLNQPLLGIIHPFEFFYHCLLIIISIKLIFVLFNKSLFSGSDLFDLLFSFRLLISNGWIHIIELFILCFLDLVIISAHFIDFFRNDLDLFPQDFHFAS